MSADDSDTTLAEPSATAPDGWVRSYRLEVVEGPQRGKRWVEALERCSIGSHPSNQIVLSDRTVSRFHCELVVDAEGARVRDLASRNGTLVDGVTVLDARLRDASLISVGRTVLRFAVGKDAAPVPLSKRTELGALVGASVPMRAAFALLEKAAASDITVLLEGESGTGKEEAAAAIHEESARADKPFVVVDCGSIPATLVESELFGHEKGAFTGATERRHGAFEQADGGTLFLDEIGELPLPLQPKLLRVLEQREVRRVGGSSTRKLDVRLVAATNRDLRAEVNAARFRADLYYRLAVLRILLPPLRQRPDDVPLLAERLLARMGADAETIAGVLVPDAVARLRRAAWPGNVRELRNQLERVLITKQSLERASFAPQLPGAAAFDGADASLPYKDARDHAIAAFEARYAAALLSKHDGNVTRAAQAAGIDRMYLHKLLKRHGLR